MLLLPLLFPKGLDMNTCQYTRTVRPGKTDVSSNRTSGMVCTLPTCASLTPLTCSATGCADGGSAPTSRRPPDSALICPRSPRTAYVAPREGMACESPQVDKVRDISLNQRECHGKRYSAGRVGAESRIFSGQLLPLLFYFGSYYDFYCHF